MPKFELVTAFAQSPELLPQRSTESSAGYDFYVAEDIVIPPISEHMTKIIYAAHDKMIGMSMDEARDYEDMLNTGIILDELTSLTRRAHAKPTLVPTGVKCQLEPNTFLQLSVRSSCPLKYWLILANGVGIIDADYYNNSDNEGHIYFQIINLSPYNIQLLKGDKIGQGIILPYYITNNDTAIGQRSGGFGSTGA